MTNGTKTLIQPIDEADLQAQNAALRSTIMSIYDTCLNFEAETYKRDGKDGLLNLTISRIKTIKRLVMTCASFKQTDSATTERSEASVTTRPQASRAQRENHAGGLNVR